MQHKRLLLISGVSISKRAEDISPDDPFPDYLALRNALQPDMLDPDTIGKTHSLIVRLVQRVCGINWAIAFAALLAARRYGAILATGEDVGLNLAFLAKLFRRRWPIVLICHNMTTRRRSFFLRKLKVGSHIRTFLCLSDAQAEIVMERYGIERERITLIYWAVDHRFFCPDRAAVVQRQICSAGAASRDYATLVQAAQGLDVDLKIAADSAWFPQRLNISADQLPTNVEARSYGNYRALRELYARSLFVVVPLQNVDFSAGYSVILEAMAMGKAVIVSRIKQQDSFICDGETGLYVAPGATAELRDRIRFLLDHPEEAQRLGNNARTAVEERFTLDHFVERVHEAIARATGS